MTAKTTAQRPSEFRVRKNDSIQQLQTERLYFEESEWLNEAFAVVRAELDRIERKLAWAYGIMVVGFGLLGGLLLAVLTR